MIAVNPRRRKRRKSRSRRGTPKGCRRYVSRALSRRRRRARSPFALKAPAGSSRSLVDSFSLNPRRRRRRNPGASLAGSGGVVGKLQAGFRPNAIMSAGALAVGGWVNFWLSEKVASSLGVRNWMMRSALGFATAGVLGAIGGKVKKGLGGPVFLGAASQALLKSIENFKALSAPAAAPVVVTTATPVASAPAPQLKGPDGDETGYLADFDGMEDDLDGFDGDDDDALQGLEEDMTSDYES